MTKRLDEKDPSETVDLSWDFVDELAGATLVSVVSVTVAIDNRLRRNTDPNPSAMLNGAAVYDGTVVVQSVSGGIHGVDYKFQAQIQTDDPTPQRISMFSVLPVRNQ